MSFLSGVGKFLKKAAPVAGFIIGNAIAPGVGGAVGAGLGSAISKSGKGKSVGDVLGAGAEGALGGAAVNTLSPGQGFSLGGLKEGLNVAKNNGVGSLFGGGTSGGMGIGDLAKLGIAGAGIYSSSKEQGKANDIADALLKQSQEQDAARAPLRSLFMQNIQNLPQSAPDLGSLFQTQNPFQRKAA